LLRSQLSLLLAILDDEQPIGVPATPGSESNGPDPARELVQLRGLFAASTDQGRDGLADRGVAASVLRGGAASLPERPDCLLLVSCPGVSACGFDVEVRAAFGWQGAGRFPLATEPDGVSYVVAFDGEGEFMDADAGWAEGGSVVDAVWEVLCGCARLGDPVGCFVGHPGVSRQDSGPHAQCSVRGEGGGGADGGRGACSGVEHTHPAVGVLSVEEELGAHIGAHLIEERVVRAGCGPADQVRSPGGHVVVAVLVRYGIGCTVREGQQPECLLAFVPGPVERRRGEAGD
jgi:hypothetical protein